MLIKKFEERWSGTIVPFPNPLPFISQIQLKSKNQSFETDFNDLSNPFFLQRRKIKGKKRIIAEARQLFSSRAAAGTPKFPLVVSVPQDRLVAVSFLNAFSCLFCACSVALHMLRTNSGIR